MVFELTLFRSGILGHQRLLAIGLFALLITGCGDSGPPGTPATQLTITPNSLFTWINLCKRVTVNFLDNDGNAARWGRDEALSLTVENATAYGTNKCDGSPLTTLYMGPDNTEAIFWIRALDFVEITVTVTGSLSGTVTLTSEVPTAKLVLGQTDFTSDTANQGGGTALGTLNAPNGVTTCGNQLFIADPSNHRVLGWTSIPTSNGQDADFVLGQPNGTSNTPSVTQSVMQAPSGVACTNDTLYVADSGNSRILGFNPIPTTTGANASFVWGQDNFTTATAGSTVQAKTRPYTLSIFGSIMLSSSPDNPNGWNRILYWATAPSESSGPTSPVDSQLPGYVFGQADFTSSSTGTTTAAVNNPQGVTISSDYLIIADGSNNRVLIYDNDSLATGASASLVMGRDDLATGFAGNEFNFPSYAVFTDDHFVVADTGNARILIWNGLPDSADDTADLVIGAPSDFSVAGTGATTAIQGVYAQIWINGAYMWVSDYNLHRVLQF